LQSAFGGCVAASRTVEQVQAGVTTIIQAAELVGNNEVVTSMATPVSDLTLVAECDEPPSERPGPKYLSPSSASTFRQCQRRWQFRYIERRPDPPGIPALVGTFVHRVLEDLLHLPPADRTIEISRKLARAIWPEVQDHAAFVAMKLDDAAARDVRWKAWRLIEAYFSMEDPVDVHVVQREQRIECELDGVPFVGVVDRVERLDDRLVVTDYKTGRAPNKRYEADRLRQVLLYAAALDEVGQRPSSARLMYIGSRSVECAVSSEAMDEVRSELAGTWNDVGTSIADETFEPTVGPLCNWCPYASECPEGQVEIERRYGPAN